MALLRKEMVLSYPFCGGELEAIVNMGAARKEYITRGKRRPDPNINGG